MGIIKISTDEIKELPNGLNELIWNHKLLKEHEEQIKQIMNKLDEKSRAVYYNRFQFNYTMNFDYMIKLIQTNDTLSNSVHPILNFWIECKHAVERGDQLIFYGLGSFVQHLNKVYEEERFFNYQIFQNIDWCYFVDKDKNKQGQLFCGKSVISPMDLVENHLDATIVIGTPNYQLEVEKELVELGIPKEKILVYPGNGIDSEIIFDSNQYFDGFVKKQEDEVFVDAGCFIGDTLEQFLQWNDCKYEKVYAFEPDLDNFHRCESYVQSLHLDNIELMNAGLYSNSGIVYFNADGNGGSHVSLNEEDKIDVLSLDEYLKGEKVTFIKMDIEGSELSALQGAKETIKKWRPKLAISLYHKKEDVFEIPAYILGLVDDYQLHVRHYSNFGIETVLYAV